MAKDTQEHITTPEKKKQSLATQVYCLNKLIAIYDACNEYDAIDYDSESFQQKKQEVIQMKKEIAFAASSAEISDQAFEEAAEKDKILKSMNIFDENGNINDEALLEETKLTCKEARDKKIEQIIELAKRDPLYGSAWKKFLKDNNLDSRIEKLKDYKDRGNGDHLREKLAENFDLLQKTDPNNALIEKIAASIKEQIDALPYKIFWVKENAKTSSSVKKYFNYIPKTNDKVVPRKEFLTFMGDLLTIGEDLTRKGEISYNDVSGKKSVYESLYNDIRIASGCPDLSDDEISYRAAIAYFVAAEGCWEHKCKVNSDNQSQKDDYIKCNVSKWIKDLRQGKNNIADLAFLNPDEDKEYNTTTNEMWKQQINAMHITVDHNIDVKYHALFSNLEDKKRLNDIWNLVLIIGGSVHKEKTDATENTNGKINKCKVSMKGKFSYYYKVKIDKKPNRCIIQTYDKKQASLRKKEPEFIQKLRATKPILAKPKTIEQESFFQTLKNRYYASR